MLTDAGLCPPGEDDPSEQVGTSRARNGRRRIGFVSICAPRGLCRHAQIGQYVSMVFGTHLVLYSSDADADRRFLAETLHMRSIDAGHGWLIFEMPPSEVAVHPAEAPGAELFLMCGDLTAEVEDLVAAA